MWGMGAVSGRWSFGDDLPRGRGRRVCVGGLLLLKGGLIAFSVAFSGALGVGAGEVRGAYACASSDGGGGCIAVAACRLVYTVE